MGFALVALFEMIAMRGRLMITTTSTNHPISISSVCNPFVLVRFWLRQAVDDYRICRRG